MLSVHLDAHIRTDNCTKGAAVAFIMVFEDTVVVAGAVKLHRHFEDPSGACPDTELAALTAFGFYDDSVGVLHDQHLNKLFIFSHSIR
jgi:hypothetical protein